MESYDNETFKINNNELELLKTYKTKTFGDIGYENINLFMNFINNPTNELLTNKRLNVDSIEQIVDAMEAFINLSCKYALNKGEIGEKIYRYEDIRNIAGYESGKLTSLKSTSNKPRTAAGTFNYENSVPLVFKSGDSFCPYIKIDEVINDASLFANEGEILLPPYINCVLTNEYEKDRFNNDSYRVVRIEDSYSAPNIEKLEDTFHKYGEYKETYAQLFKRDKEQRKVSEELKNATEAINNYLKEYARCQYYKYNELFKRKHNIEEKNIATDSSNQYQGIYDSINKYFTNKDPNKSWAIDQEYGVYALEYLVENNFIPKDILSTTYNNHDLGELEKFLKERNDNSEYSSISDETYQKFLKLFNIASGYDQEKSTREERINAANILAYGDYIEENQR